MTNIKKVERLEKAMRDYEQVEIPVKHHFAHHSYAREITIPAGTLATGKIHKYSQINIIAKGDVSVTTENGVLRIKAPYVLVSPPGTKRAVFAHKETVWITVHGTDETDVEKIEQKFIAKDSTEYLEFREKLEDKWPG